MTVDYYQEATYPFPLKPMNIYIFNSLFGFYFLHKMKENEERYNSR